MACRHARCCAAVAGGGWVRIAAGVALGVEVMRKGVKGTLPWADFAQSPKPAPGGARESLVTARSCRGRSLPWHLLSCTNLQKGAHDPSPPGCTPAVRWWQSCCSACCSQLLAARQRHQDVPRVTVHATARRLGASGGRWRTPSFQDATSPSRMQVGALFRTPGAPGRCR